MLKVIVLVTFGTVGLYGVAALISRIIIPDWQWENLKERQEEYDKYYRDR